MANCKVIAIANQKGGTGKTHHNRQLRNRACQRREKGSFGGR